MSAEFTIARGKNFKNPFTFNVLQKINVGVEGEKYIAKVSTRRGDLGEFFLKPRSAANDTLNQREKYQHFKRNGVRVPKIFKPIVFDNGEPYIAVEDMSCGGKYWFLGSNNPESYLPEVKKLISKIPESTKKIITQDMIKACEVAVISNSNIESGCIYEFQKNAFLLLVNPKNLSESRVYLADFGLDVMARESWRQTGVLERNIKSAALFYASMIGEKLDLPEKYFLDGETQIEISNILIEDQPFDRQTPTAPPDWYLHD